MRKPLPFKKKLLASLIRGAVVATVAMPAMSWAQSSDATLRGKAPPQMQITAKNIATGARRVTMSGADGSYALVGLSPGTYQVDAGPGTERTVTLSVASTGQLDFAAPSSGAPAAGAAQLEGVTVTGTTLTEVKTSEIGTNISQYQIATIPQLTRNFLEFADTVPGMAFNVTGSGKTSIQGGVQDSSKVNVYIDGVGQKNYVHGGGISGQAGPNHDGDLGNPFPQLAIGEYKVITSNYKAEYDQISSAAITAQTKSGTNEFHGEVYGNATNQDWRSATPAEQAAGGTKTKSADKEYGFAIGGPIIQDAMHFFFTYEGKNIASPTTVYPPAYEYNGQSYGSFLPANVRAQYGGASQPFDEDLYFGKIDWEFSDRDRVEVSSKVRKESEVFGATGQTAASAEFNYNNNDTRVDAKWQHTADAWMNELLLTYEKTLDNPQAITAGPGQNYIWQGPSSSQGVNGSVLLINGQDARQYFLASQKGHGIQDDLTFNSFNWYGDHVIKMGVKYKDVTLTDRDTSDAAVYDYAVTPSGTATDPYSVVFGKANGGALTAVSKDKQFGAYIQDDWAVNDKLTLNLGVRWDYEQMPLFTDYTVSQTILNALNSPYPAGGPVAPTPGETYMQALQKGGLNLNDYIGNGHNRSLNGHFQPRLGFSYDLGGDEEHVIFGGAGRAYDRNLFDVLSLENSKNAISVPTVNFKNAAGINGCSLTSPDAPNCVAWDPKYLNAANLQTLGAGVGEVDMINNNLKTPYSDQFSIGMRNKVGDWNTSVTLARINSYNGIVGELGNRYADGTWYNNGSQWSSSGVPGIGGLILWDNGKKTINNQLLVSVDKPYTKDSGWSAGIAYTYTDAKYNRLYTDQYAFDYPYISDYPMVTSNGAPKHRLVMTGSYDAPWDITLAGKLVLETRTPYNQINGCDGSAPCGGVATSNGYGGHNFSDTAIPKGGDSFLFGGPIFGYREIDLQASKNFDLTRGMVFQIRFDILNAFNYKNYDPQNGGVIWNYLSNQATSPHYVSGAPILGVPRTFKFSMDFKF
jgi:outer membrane receptor protein involved in Fe transport